MKYGVVTHINKMITMLSIKHQVNSNIAGGIIWSMVSKSDVNLFKILPVGTVSKNFIGPFMILVSKFVWIAFEAPTHLKKIGNTET